MLHSKYRLQMSFERQWFELTWRRSKLQTAFTETDSSGLVFAKFHSNLTGVVSPEQILLVFIVSFFTRSAKTTVQVHNSTGNHG